MSIKSDTWIRRQCTLPTFMKKMLVPQHSSHHDVYIHPKEVWIATHETEDEIQQQMLRYQFTDTGVHDYRELTSEERASFKPMISPFETDMVREFDGKKVVSYGTSSYGYDIRCADDFKVFTNINSTIVDPKAFDPQSFVEVSGKGYCIIPPNSFALARTVEYFRIPRNVLTICVGKSTYARTGIVVNVTPFEPEWEGYVTLEFSNTTPLPAKIYAHEGCAQVLFFESDEVCSTSYADRNGKYQGQGAYPTPPTV